MDSQIEATYFPETMIQAKKIVIGKKAGQIISLLYFSLNSNEFVDWKKNLNEYGFVIDSTKNQGNWKYFSKSDKIIFIRSDQITNDKVRHNTYSLRFVEAL